MRNYTKIYITPKGERAARSGHPWVYAEASVPQEAAIPGYMQMKLPISKELMPMAIWLML